MTRYRIGLLAIALLIAGVVLLTVFRPPMPPSLSDNASAAVLPDSERVAAPDFTGIDGWVNTPPLTLQQLRGHVVLIDFWTFSCVNCVRTIPHLAALNMELGPRGLVIVGVHSPEFDFEKVRTNVEDAVHRLGVTWPVAIDSEMATWNAYSNQYWPAEYLLDKQGRVAYTHAGEGDYEATAKAAALLLGVGAPAPAPASAVPGDISPELYAGSARGQLAAGESYGALGQPVTYPDPGMPSQTDVIQLSGTWADFGQYIEADSPGHVRLRFHASNLYVVAGSTGGSPAVQVTLDGAAPPAGLAGPDLRSGVFGVTRQDLYSVLRNVGPGVHVIDLAVAPGFRLYTFTFG